jgi:hypothetical protein
MFQSAEYCASTVHCFILEIKPKIITLEKKIRDRIKKKKKRKEKK